MSRDAVLLSNLKPFFGGVVKLVVDELSVTFNHITIRTDSTV